jgi:hypothetical protein
MIGCLRPASQRPEHTGEVIAAGQHVWVVRAQHPQRSLPPSAHPDAAGATRFDQLKRENADLRRDNHELTEHLELAVANIQRLCLETHQLRQQLEAATNVTRIDPRHRPTAPATRPR